MKKGFSLLLTAAVITAFAVVSCSGGGGGGGNTACTETPIIITPGTWCITLTKTQNTCNVPLDPNPYPATFTQNGSTINSTAGSATFAGTVCGNRAAMTGTNSGVSANVTITFSDASHAAGSTAWDNGTCGGTDTFTAHAGNCP